MFKRRTLLAAAPLAALGATVASTLTQAATYSDLTPTTLFYTEITWALNKGLLTGYPDGTFRPTGSIDRQTLARTLYIYRGKPTYTPPAKSPFTDVPTGHPFYKEINWMVSQGITTGYPDKTFRPTNTMNRDAFAAFLYRMAGSPFYTPPTTLSFPDVQPTELFIRKSAGSKILRSPPAGPMEPISL